MCAIIFSICLGGCSNNQANLKTSGKTQQKKHTFSQTQYNELAELTRKPLQTTTKSYREQTRMENDNSVVETMYDAFGNKTESRVFHNDSLLKMIVLRTSTDGEKQALVYGQNGEVKTAPPTLLNKVLTTVAGEIAKAVEIFEGRKENAMLAKLQAPKTPPTEEFSPVNANLQTVEETAPVVENTVAEEKSEPVIQNLSATGADVKTVEAKDFTSKFRTDVQTLKAVKKNLIAQKLD
jgi:hypothetical protein